jgi:general secretion pathway protein A
MYTDYWHLNEKPFELTPDPRYVYYSKQIEDALLRLIYTVQDRKGAMLLTGMYGCGKTVLSRVFLNELVGTKFEVALITNPRLSGNELLTEIIYQLGGGLLKNETKGQLLRIFNEMLYANLNQGKETVVVIDEAQSIENLETFEELRMLLNYQQNDRFLLTLVLIGQSELRKRLKELPQLKQRLVIDYNLNPMDEQETQSYLEHRLTIAGATKPLFDAGAKRLIYRYSGGVPRVINGMCDMALLEGFIQQKNIVDETIIKKVVKEGNVDPAIWVNA